MVTIHCRMFRWELELLSLEKYKHQLIIPKTIMIVDKFAGVIMIETFSLEQLQRSSLYNCLL